MASVEVERRVLGDLCWAADKWPLAKSSEKPDSMLRMLSEVVSRRAGLKLRLPICRFLMSRVDYSLQIPPKMKNTAIIAVLMQFGRWPPMRVSMPEPIGYSPRHATEMRFFFFRCVFSRRCNGVASAVDGPSSKSRRISHQRICQRNAFGALCGRCWRWLHLRPADDTMAAQPTGMAPHSIRKMLGSRVLMPPQAVCSWIVLGPLGFTETPIVPRLCVLREPLV